MKTTTLKKPDLVQAFDYYEDRIYYKIIGGFFMARSEVIRKDRLHNWKVWKIECEGLPDEIFVNGKKFKLVAEIESK